MIKFCGDPDTDCFPDSPLLGDTQSGINRLLRDAAVQDMY